MDISRRNFITGALACGSIGALAGLSGCAKTPSTLSETGTQDLEGANHPWQQKPEPITDIAETKTADIIIIGAGVAGVAASAKASELGSAIVIEKSGAPAEVREGEWAFGASCQKTAGMEFTPEMREQVIAEYFEQCHYFYPSQEVVNSFVDHSAELVDWIEPILAKQGIIVQVAPTYGPFGVSYGTPGFPVQNWFEPLIDYAESNGTEFVFNQRALQLVQNDDGSIAGVIAETNDKRYIQYNATKGVVLCAGGFGKNKEMMEEFFPRAKAITRDAFLPTHDGDGLIMGMQVGAEMDEVAWGDAYLGADTDLPNPATEAIAPIYWPCCAVLPMLYVDESGRRKMNEACVPRSLGKPYTALSDYEIGDAMLWQPHGYMWSLWDSMWQEKLANTSTISTTTSKYPAPEIHSPEALERDVDNGVTVKADTLEELAEKTGLDLDTLSSTIERYNTLCKQGSDDDFYKETIWMTSIDTPPYYACKITGYPCCTRGGLRINGHGQVLGTDGHIIKGLYASGLNAGGVQGFYATLSSCSSTQMFGYLGVQHAHGLL